MGNFLNLVYDTLNVTKEEVTNYMDTYVGFSNYKVFHINEIPDNDEKYYYFFEYRYYLTSYIVAEKKLPFNNLVLDLLKTSPNFNIIIKNDAESDDDILIESDACHPDMEDVEMESYDEMLLTEPMLIKDV